MVDFRFSGFGIKVEIRRDDRNEIANRERGGM